MHLSLNRSWALPVVLFVLLTTAWFAVVVLGGVVGPVAWWFLIGLGFVGIVFSSVGGVFLVLKLVRRKAIKTNFIAFLMLSMIAAWPGGWMVGVGQIAYPARLHAVQPQVSIRLPFNRPALVGWGGDSLKENYHAWMPCERWAYDLLMPPATIQSKRLQDYGIYEETVVAPIAGTIVGAYDDEPDILPDAENNQSMLGNYIFLRLEETHTYLVLAHLKQGSVQVQVGQYVEEGTPIAQVGNSGSSSEPHLHIQHQRQDPSQGILLLAEGLPLYFRDNDGATMPRGGTAIQNGVEVPVGDIIFP